MSKIFKYSSQQIPEQNTSLMGSIKAMDLKLTWLFLNCKDGRNAPSSSLHSRAEAGPTDYFFKNTLCWHLGCFFVVVGFFGMNGHHACIISEFEFLLQDTCFMPLSIKFSS